MRFNSRLINGSLIMPCVRRLIIYGCGKWGDMALPSKLEAESRHARAIIWATGRSGSIGSDPNPETPGNTCGIDEEGR